MTTILEQLLHLVPLALAGAVQPEERNVLLVPPGPPLSAQQGPLRHPDANPLPDPAAPRRIVVVVGPGVTFQGIADVLLPVFQAATGSAVPTREELAKALVVYHRPTLAVGPLQVGMLLPVPIEIAPATGAWTVSSDRIRTLAGTPVATGLLSTPALPLEIPDPIALAAAAKTRITGTPVPAVAQRLWTETLRNPYESVLLFIAVLRALPGSGPADAARAALAGVTGDQLILLAGTRAGNALLRRLEQILLASPGGSATLLTQLDGALREGPPGHRTAVAHRDLPQTPGGLAVRTGRAKFEDGDTADPPGGIHRVVLGRDVAVGTARSGRTAGTTFTGPDFGGRLDLAAYLAVDDQINPPPAGADVGDFRIENLLMALTGATDRGRLDAVQAGDLGLARVGIERCSARDTTTTGLAALLFRFKGRAPEEFDLFFGIHGLDAEATGGAFALIKVAADGSRSVLSGDSMVAFFGGTKEPGGQVTFTADWAARFRLAALASAGYRRSQVAGALIRLSSEVPLPFVASLNAPLPVPKSDDSLTPAKSFVVSSSTRALADILSYRFLQGPGPAPGAHGTRVDVGKILIDAGKLAADPLDATKFRIPTAMRISAPADPARPGVVGGHGRLPVVVLVHGNHIAWRPTFGPPSGTVTLQYLDAAGNLKTGPFDVIDTATSIVDVPNHEGYILLQDALAAAGIVSVSVNTNAANFFGSNIDMRVRTAQAALDHLATLNTTAGSPYFGRLDLKNIGLMGHSRGGDVVVALARRLRGSGTYTVKAVCSLAPTDFTGTATDTTRLVLTSADTGFYLVIYGSLDGDVAGDGGVDGFTGTGFRHYDRASCAKAMVQLAQCCHNRFNAVWSGGTPPAPGAGDDTRIVPADVGRLRSFGKHQQLEVEYMTGMFRWHLLGDVTARDLLRGLRPNKAGVPASLQWSFGAGTRALDDLEAATPTLPGATRTLVKGSTVSFDAVTVPGSTLESGGGAGPVAIAEHATHRSKVLAVDATVAATAEKKVMTLGIPADQANWRGFAWLTFRLSYTLDISSGAALTGSPLPKVGLVLRDTAGKERRLDALRFTPGVPSRPEYHLVKSTAGTDDVTLFRFETVRVPLAEFAAAGGVDLAKVQQLTVEFDPANNTHVLYDSFQLVKR